MNIQKPKRKRIVVATTIIVALTLSGVAYSAYSSTWPFSKNTTSPSDSDKNSKDSLSNTNKVPDNSASTVENPKSSQAKEPKAKPGNDLTVTITSTSQTEDTVRIRTLIDTVTSTGECTLEATNNQTSAKIIKNTDIQALPNGSTCRGFDVTKSEMTTGSWTVVVTSSIDDKSGLDKTKVEVK